MKKKRMKRTKHFNNSEKFDWKLFAVCAAFFLVFAFLLTATSIPTNATTTGHLTDMAPGEHTPVGETNFIADFFTGWNAGEADITIVKYLFLIMLTLFIGSVLNFVGFPGGSGKGSKFLQFLLALIISFLATAFITPMEVFTLLTSYEALGMALVSIIPFLIILFSSATLLAGPIGEMNVGKIMMEVVLWFAWSAFLLYRLIKLWAINGIASILEGGIVMLVVFAASILILIFNKPFRNWVNELNVSLIESRERILAAREAARERSRRTVHEASER